VRGLGSDVTGRSFCDGRGKLRGENRQLARPQYARPAKADLAFKVDDGPREKDVVLPDIRSVTEHSDFIVRGTGRHSHCASLHESQLAFKRINRNLSGSSLNLLIHPSYLILSIHERPYDKVASRGPERNRRR